MRAKPKFFGFLYVDFSFQLFMLLFCTAHNSKGKLCTKNHDSE